MKHLCRISADNKNQSDHITDQHVDIGGYLFFGSLGVDRHPKITDNGHAGRLFKDLVRWIFSVETREVDKDYLLIKYLSACA